MTVSPSPDDRLEDERHRLTSAVTSMERALSAMVEASTESNADDEHDPEGATIAFERAQLAAQLAHARAGLAAVAEAVARRESGAYDVCSHCGGPIGAERLEARPSATTCITCAAR